MCCCFALGQMTQMAKAVSKFSPQLDGLTVFRHSLSHLHIPNQILCHAGWWQIQRGSTMPRSTRHLNDSGIGWNLPWMAPLAPLPGSQCPSLESEPDRQHYRSHYSIFGQCLYRLGCHGPVLSDSVWHPHNHPFSNRKILAQQYRQSPPMTGLPPYYLRFLIGVVRPRILSLPDPKPMDLPKVHRGVPGSTGAICWGRYGSGLKHWADQVRILVEQELSGTKEWDGIATVTVGTVGKVCRSSD